MIAISTTEQHMEIKIRVQRKLMHKAFQFINEYFTFDDIRKIEYRKQKELHDAGLHFFKTL